jgi:hypothetical protein
MCEKGFPMVASILQILANAAFDVFNDKVSPHTSCNFQSQSNPRSQGKKKVLNFHESELSFPTF